MSIEVSAGGRAFIVDPGTYVYSADLARRHEFRSTAYHSTVQIDGREQSTIDIQTPFVIGNEANPKVLEWTTNGDFDKVVAEHYGYSPMTHRRTVIFNKSERHWVIDDEFFGDGDHLFEVRFHFAPGLDVSVNGSAVEARDSDKSLLVSLLNPKLHRNGESACFTRLWSAQRRCFRLLADLGQARQAYLEDKLATDSKISDPYNPCNRGKNQCVASAEFGNTAQVRDRSSPRCSCACAMR